MDAELGSSSNQAVGFAGTTECRYIELLKWSDMSTVEPKEGVVDDHSLPEWLRKAENSSNNDGRILTGGLRLLIGIAYIEDSNCVSISISSRGFDIAGQHLGLPAIFLDHMNGIPTQAFQFSKEVGMGNLCHGFVFKLSSKRGRLIYQFSIVHDHTSNLTQGLLLISESSQRVLPRFLQALASQKAYCDQPLLLPTIASELQLVFSQNRLKIMVRKLRDLEQLVGEKERRGRPRGNPLDIDYLATTRAFNYVSKKVGIDKMTITCMLGILEKMRKFKETIDCADPREAGAKPHTVGSRIVEDKSEYIKDTCTVLVTVCQYHEKRIATLIQVVYQFMAQKDAKVNIALAESSAAIAKANKEDTAIMRTIAIESKKDSSAMKTIAVLGMLFLPGTFVAAIFAMPVFDWDRNTPIIKPGFKYYWAVTGPLTLFVLLSWALAMLLPWKLWISMVNGRRKDSNGEVELTI